MAANSVEHSEIIENVILSNWGKLKVCLQERRLPKRLYDIVPTTLSKLSGQTVVYCSRGRRKFLRFNLTDMPFAEHILWEIFTAYAYFPILNRFASFSINRGDTVIDIGANIGLFAVYAASRSGHGQVYSFEPCGANFARLVYHQQHNRLSNLHIINKGISDRAETVELYLTDENCGAHSMMPAFARGREKHESIECISLQQVFDEYTIDHCHYLKLDCEGAEAKIISALPSEYYQRIDRIAMEYHPNVDVSELASILHDHGFQVMVLGYPEKSGMVFAIK